MKKFRPPELEGYKFKKSKVKPLTSQFSHRLTVVARYWGIMPWELRSLPPYRAGELIAAHDVDKEIEAYYSDEYSKRADRDSAIKDSANAGPGSFRKGIPFENQ